MTMYTSFVKIIVSKSLDRMDPETVNNNLSVTIHLGIRGTVNVREIRPRELVGWFSVRLTEGQEYLQSPRSRSMAERLNVCKEENLGIEQREGFK